MAVAVAHLAGCGGGTGGAPRVTLTDAGCTYEGSSTPKVDAYGDFEITVDNETSRFTHISLARLDNHVQFDDTDAVLAQFRRALSKGVRNSPFARRNPPWMLVTGGDFGPASSTDFPVDASSSASSVRAGRYVVVCWLYSAEDTRQSSSDRAMPDQIFATGQLTLDG
jgi:hypothetical protein